jgi:hypothetical protein
LIFEFDSLKGKNILLLVEKIGVAKVVILMIQIIFTCNELQKIS